MKKGFGIFFVIVGSLSFLVSISEPDLIGVGLIQMLFWGGIGLWMIKSANKKQKEKEKGKDLKKIELTNSIDEILKSSKSNLQEKNVKDLKKHKDLIQKICSNVNSNFRLRPDFQLELVREITSTSQIDMSFLAEGLDRDFKVKDRIDDIESRYKTNEIQFKNNTIDKEEYEKNKISIKRKYYSPSSSIIKISEKLHSLGIITKNELNVTKEQYKLIENKEKDRLINIILNQYQLLEKIKREINWSKV